jgi:4-methyl-5(b-hydroxyethyl)-thiazole monophosphate biosynthesis
MNKRLCVLLGDGVEEIELITPVDIFRRCGIDVVLASAKNSLQIHCAHNIELSADTTIHEISASNFDGLVLPGGPGSFSLVENVNVLNLVKSFHAVEKLICAICAAPLILQNAGILENRKYCSHPCTYSTLKDSNQNEKVVVDKNLITAKGPGTAAEFAFAIVEYLHGSSMVSKMRADLFF